jgi:hypothetical protein
MTLAEELDHEATQARARASLSRERGNDGQAEYSTGRAEALRWAAELLRRGAAVEDKHRIAAQMALNGTGTLADMDRGRALARVAQAIADAERGPR